MGVSLSVCLDELLHRGGSAEFYKIPSPTVG